MGAGASSCTQLDQFSNGCEIHKCAIGIKGLESNSSSPSDTWILKLENSKYEDKVINNVFVKYFIEPDTLVEPDRKTQMLKNVTHGLKYELYIYKDIIRPLIDTRICPNFIKYLGSGEMCEFSSLQKILSDAVIRTPEATFPRWNEPVKMANDLLERNLLYMANGLKNRPSIANTRPAKSELLKSYPKMFYKEIDPRWRYNFIINEPISETTKSFSDYLPTIKSDELSYSLLIQVVYACYCLSENKTNHNDLHSGNIFVAPLDEAIIMTYNLGDFQLSFKTEHLVVLYDFDLAYSEHVGDNPYIDEDRTRSNEFVVNKDLWKFVFQLYKDSSLGDLALSLLSDNAGKKRALRKYFNDPEAFFLMYNDGQIPKKTMNKYKSPKDCLKNFKEMLDMNGTKYTPDPKYTFGNQVTQIVQNIIEPVSDSVVISSWNFDQKNYDLIQTARESKYDNTYLDCVVNAMEILGALDSYLAEAFRIVIRTTILPCKVQELFNYLEKHSSRDKHFRLASIEADSGIEFLVEYTEKFMKNNTAIFTGITFIDPQGQENGHVFVIAKNGNGEVFNIDLQNPVRSCVLGNVDCFNTTYNAGKHLLKIIIMTNIENNSKLNPEYVKFLTSVENIHLEQC